MRVAGLERWWRVGLVALVAVGVLPAVASAEPIVVERGFLGRDLGLAVTYGYDPSGTRSVDDVRAGAVAFAPSPKAHPNFGYRGGAEWVRVPLEDARGVAEPLVLTLDYGQTDRAELFPAGASKPLVAGDHVPRERWPFDHRTAAFPIAPGTRGDVYVRVTGEAAHQLTMRLESRDAFEASRRRDVALQSLYFGAIFAIAAYNLLVALLTASRVYFAYVGFLASFATFQAGHLGLVYAHAFPFPGLADFVHVCAVASTLAFTSSFARRMVPMDRDAPRVARALTVAGYVALAATLTFPFVGYGRVMRFELPIIGVALVTIVWASAVSWRRGDRTSGLFLLAWSAFLVGSLLAVLRQLAVVPVNTLTENAQQVGSLLEALLLSFALADRIKQLQADLLRKTQESFAASQRALEEQQKTARELQRLDRLKDEFFSNTSHELRTPVHAILGLSEALAERAHLTREDRDVAETIARSGRRLASIVASVVDFAALKRGDLVVEAQPGDLARLVRDEIASLSNDGVPIRVEVEPGLPMAAIDASRMRQAVAHVVGNARKFTRSGHIDVRLRATDDAVELAVSDTGIGIEADRLATLFDGFEQGDGSSTREAGGIGIGLALAKRIVVAHRGSIDVESEVGRGTVVRMRVPAAPPGAPTQASPVRDAEASRKLVSLVPPKPSSLAPPKPASIAPPASASPGRLVLALPDAGLSPGAAMVATARTTDGGAGASLPPASLATPMNERIRLLVADDDAVNRRVIQMQIGALGFDLVEAVDGRDALEKLEAEGPFDGVLLDVMMPHLDGYGVCRELRKKHPANELPVLMLTAKTRVQDLVAGFEAGANDYVPKPFAKAELLARIRTHVTMSRTSQAMSRFVPRESLDLLGRENVVDVRLGDTAERELAVLFADVRGFTQLAEELGPTSVFALLNDCYARIGPEIRESGGFVDKYIGDAVMALFPAGPASAVRAAVRMQRVLRDASDLARIKLGVGVHVGPTLLGTLGEPMRFEATVISDAVNVAARLEGVAKQIGASLVVSAEVARTLDAETLEDSRPLGTFAVKGKTRTVDLVEVFAADDADSRERKRASRERFGEARTLFRDGAAQGARVLLESLCAAAPDDAPLRWWLGHVERASDAGDEDRGVVRLDAK
jgi:signal transduction histidine kinase/class 3 adenylate cyclase